MPTARVKEWFLRKRRMIVTGIIVSCILLLSVIPMSVIYADGFWDSIVWKFKDIDKGEAIAFLKNEWIQYANFLGSVFQSIEGWIIKGLLVLVSSLEDIIPETFSLLDLLEDAGLNDFAASMMKGMFFAILVLVIAWLGIKTIVYHKPPHFKTVGVNIVVMVGLVAGLNELMADMQKISKDFYEDATKDGKMEDSLAFNLVKHNTADLVYLSQVGFDSIKKENKEAISKDKSAKNGLNENMYLNASLGDLVTPKMVKELKDKSVEETKFLAYKITNDGASEALESVDDSWFDPFEDKFPSGYVRYPMNFFTIFWGLLALGIAYVYTIFVFVMTIFEIAMKKIIAPFVFVTDLESGQKTKMVLQDIMNGFLVFAFTGLSLRFYIIAVNYLSDTDINGFLYIVSMICLTTALIKGSESILKYFGIDVGLKEGKNNLMGALGALSSANGVRKGLTNMGRSVQDKLSGQGRADTPKRSESDDKSDNIEGNSDGNSSGNQKNSGLQPKKIARNTGAALGYMKNRGIGGMVNDAGHKMGESVTGAVDKGKEAVSGVAKGVTGSVKGTIDEFKGGQSEGKQKAQENADRQTLGKIGKDVQNNANAGKENSSTPKMEEKSQRNMHVANQKGSSNRQDNVQQESTQGSMKGEKQTAERELELQNKLRNTGREEGQQGNMKGEKQTAERELELQNKLRNTGREEPQQGNVKGEKQTAERELELQNKLRNTGREEGQQGNMKGEKQIAERELELQNKLRNTGREEGQQGNVKGEKQTAEREIELQNKLRNTGGVNESQADVKAGSATIERDINIQDKVKGNNTVSGEVKAGAATVERDVNIQDRVKGNNTVNGDVKAGSATVERDVNIQDRVKGNNTVSGDVKAGATTVQRDVNVQNNVRGSGEVTADVKAGATTVQRDVNVQNNVRGSGEVTADVKAGATTVQRDVNVQNNVRGSGEVTADIKAGATTVQRDVNVQNNVRGSSEVTADVRAGATTVQRDVNVQNNVRGSSEVTADVRAGATTVQRDVNVQNNVRGSSEVTADVRAGATTVQRDVNVQDNVREGSVSRFKKRGSTDNRTNGLRGR
ncbi:pLS20_p028 family conjugation system transmembrane protein [Bacillus cereus group sp. MYBK185-1]|uniref:pLS20_p028 family conjugation system transmembrane protein n=1 Tax=Bacillus cereus group sp. MYBK185-1 TaxID=3450672 RepID=UPI003F7AD736